MTPTVGLALIVRDEESTLPRLLASIEGAFDQVYMVDTGSTDDTKGMFWHWAEQEEERARTEGRSFLWDIGNFEWCDDFSAARNFADRYLVTDFCAWADADDVLRGAENLRALAASAPPNIAGFVAGYDYAQDDAGRCVCYLRRERLVRRGRGTWQGRIHEAQVVDGDLIHTDAVEWVHRKNMADFDPERNLKYLLAWLEDEPTNARVLQYVGTEHAARGQHAEAEAAFRAYLDQPLTWLEERAQVLRKLALVLMAQDRYDEAIDVGFTGIRTLPDWPDSYLTLAEAFYRLSDPERAEKFARRVLELGMPRLSSLILNPLDYSVQPRAILAGSLGARGRIEEAMAIAEEAFEIVPDEPRILAGYEKWKRQRKVVETVARWVEMIETLEAHDEQLKALEVAKSAPHYVIEHPAIVAARSRLRGRVQHLFNSEGYAEHYTDGGSKPEDFVDDEQVLPLGDALPRAEFLLRGLEEQLEEAA